LACARPTVLVREESKVAMSEQAMPERIRVAILEDHPVIVDAYRYYLQDQADIELVAAIEVGEALPTVLIERAPIHVLILDVGVPTSHTTSSAYPILYLLADLLHRHPQLNVLVISMHKSHAMIKALIDAGASGYVFKDDRETLQKFSAVIRMIAAGGIYFSRDAHKIVMQQSSQKQLLSPRQLEVLSLCAAYPEKSTAELARQLSVADTTVRNTLSILYERLGVRGRVAALAKAREMGLIADVTPTYPLGDPNASTNVVH
jgi:DNA-binding NarL/FixJ family response regulator